MDCRGSSRVDFRGGPGWVEVDEEARSQVHSNRRRLAVTSSSEIDQRSQKVRRIDAAKGDLNRKEVPTILID